MIFNPFQFFGQNEISVGIDISDKSIKVLALNKQNNGKLLAKAFGYITIEEGIVENGRIIDTKKFSSVLKEVFEKTQPKPIMPKKIFLAIPESRTFINIYKVNRDLMSKDLEHRIRVLAAESIPFNPDDLYFDFKEIYYDKKSKRKEILYVASPKEIIDKYIDSFHSIGIKTIIIDIESASLARALTKKENKQENILILDMGARTTNMSIIDRGEICSSASFPFGGNHLTKSIATNLKLSFEEADRMKITLGMDEKVGDNKILPTLNSFCSLLLDEIKKEIDHYQKKNKRKIKTIIICGGSSLVVGIDACLEAKIGIQVQRVNPWINWKIEINSEDGKMYLKKEEPILYATVIGLALRGLEKNPKSVNINLLKFKGHSLS
jgi:type IV pilus assembly protein PilM